jgi:2-methylcitrate dehydratase PrpD
MRRSAYIAAVVAAGRMEGVDVSKATAELGQWHIADTWRVKKYPYGYIAQGAIDAALRLREATGLRLEDLTSVEIRVPDLQPYFKAKPTGEFSGKFGYEYPVACAIQDGEVVKKTFSNEAFNRAAVKSQLGKFRTLGDPASKDDGPLGVLVVEAKGRTIRQPIEIPVGDCKRPLAAAKVVEKYVRNAQEVVAADVAKRTADMLLDIEILASIRRVLDLLAKRS